MGIQTSPGIQDSLVVQVKEENRTLHKSIKNLNMRIGDEIIGDEDSELSDDSDIMNTPIRTHDPFVDNQFGKQYIYMTNVCLA